MSHRTTGNKYTRAERTELWNAIRPLFALGKENAAIAIALTAKGFTAPGNLSLTASTIAGQLTQMGLRRYKCRSSARAAGQVTNGHGAKPKSRRIASLPEISISLIGEILTNPGISEAARLELLRSTLIR